jgi:hypothetical protein
MYITQGYDGKTSSGIPGTATRFLGPEAIRLCLDTRTSRCDNSGRDERSLPAVPAIHGRVSTGVFVSRLFVRDGTELRSVGAGRVSYGYGDEIGHS